MEAPFRVAGHGLDKFVVWICLSVVRVDNAVNMRYPLRYITPFRRSGMPKAARRSTSMTLDAEVLEEARRLGINVSQAAQMGVIAAIGSERARIWKQENAGAVADYNTFIEKSGVPMAEFRKF